MDNYYTSPAILIFLSNRGIYARRTVKKNRRMVPSHIILTKTDCKKSADGYVQMAVCELAKMQAFGWNENNPVHILSTTYSSQNITTVWRQCGAARLQIPCPRAIHIYSDGMKGVDRHDQLRSTFALASCHDFKKYYITHHLTQVDIGITNAGIYFSLAHPHLKNKEGQRRKFNEDIALQFIAANSLDWQTLYDNSVLDAIDSGATHTPGDSDDEDIFHLLGVPNCSENLFPIKDLAVTYHPTSTFYKELMALHEIKLLAKQGGDSVTTIYLKKLIEKNYRNCQVCDYEGRCLVMNQTTYCKIHCVRMCMQQHQDTKKVGLEKVDSNELVTYFYWLCPDTDLSCWQKFHLWYQPRGLFLNPRCIVEKASGCLRFGHLCVSKTLFKKKKMAFGEDCFRGMKPKKRPRLEGEEKKKR
jgi:hypothetical protein